MLLKNLFQSDTRPPGDPFAREEPDACCGRHSFCQKESGKNISRPAEYYDDEELDIFVDRSSDSYDEEEVESFAEILHTMLVTDIPGWISGLQLRGIVLPDALRAEVLRLISD